MIDWMMPMVESTESRFASSSNVCAPMVSNTSPRTTIYGSFAVRCPRAPRKRQPKPKRLTRTISRGATLPYNAFTIEGACKPGLDDMNVMRYPVGGSATHAAKRSQF